MVPSWRLHGGSNPSFMVELLYQSGSALHSLHHMMSSVVNQLQSHRLNEMGSTEKSRKAKKKKSKKKVHKERDKLKKNKKRREKHRRRKDEKLKNEIQEQDGKVIEKKSEDLTDEGILFHIRNFY